MFAITSTYRRKDGTRARQYLCRGYHNSDGTCAVKVDAEAVDTAVIERLPRLMPDFDEWIAQIEDRHAAERDRLDQERDRAVADATRSAGSSKPEDRWLALDAEEQNLLTTLGRAQRRAQRRRPAPRPTEDALASIPEDVSHDRLLDFASSCGP